MKDNYEQISEYELDMTEEECEKWNDTSIEDNIKILQEKTGNKEISEYDMYSFEFNEKHTMLRCKFKLFKTKED